MPKTVTSNCQWNWTNDVRDWHVLGFMWLISLFCCCLAGRGSGRSPS